MKVNIMKKKILLSLALLLTLSTLSQEAIAARLHIGHDTYLPRLSREEQTFPIAHIASVDELKSLIIGKFANSHVARTKLTLRDMTSDNLIFKVCDLDYRILDEEGLAYINAQLAQGNLVQVDTYARVGAMIHGDPTANPPYNHDFPLPAHLARY
jgi:hypothetical protein